MARINWIEVRGFRAFGATPQRIGLSGDFSLVWGPNSQGKTSFAEAIEFLLTGKTVRREFLASATREFADCLRNAHLPAGEPVEVAGEIVDAAGIAHTVKRTLVDDYSPTAACRSTLLIDGVAAADLSSLGVRLSLPPLEAPILMHHTLRYVLSAKPQDRTDYFKALLEVADLETVRGAIDQARTALRAPTSTLLETLARCEGQPALVSHLRPLRANAPSRRAVAECLTHGLGQILATHHDPVPPALTDRVTLARRVIAERERGTFPMDGFRSSAPAGVQIDAATWAALDRFVELVARVERETARLSELFAAVLRVPIVESATGPIDCPVCKTPNALHPARVAEIRQHLADTDAFRAGRAAAGAALRRVTEFADQLERGAVRARPTFLGWAVAERERRGFTDPAISEMLGAAADTLITPWRERLGPLESAGDAVATAAAELRELAAGTDVDALRSDQVVALRNASETLRRAFADFSEVHAGYLTDQVPLVAALEAEVGRRSQTQVLRDVVALVDQSAPLLEVLILAQAHAQVGTKLDRAIRDVDAAAGRVLDSKFSALGDDVGRWWSYLRPEEPTSFAGIQRAGTGRRYIDLKAKLSPEVDGSGAHTLRDVVAVFSDSQLNCLGLAAFLARTVRAGTGFVVLDDPVPASDEEHRAFFLDKVLSELHAASCQVILLTHEQGLWKDAQVRYEYLPLSVLQIILDDPRAGSLIEETADTLLAALNRARPFVGKNNPDMRKMAVKLLRDAEERFCKLLLVKDRKANGDLTANLSDYAGKVLGELHTLVIPLLRKDPSDPGKLRVMTGQLNPGNHDDNLPPASDLKISFGNLSAFHRDYLSAAPAPVVTGGAAPT